MISLILESFWRFLSRTFLWSAFLLLLLSAIYVSVGRVLLNGISEFKSTLENNLSSSLQAVVSVSGLSGEFVGLNPIISVLGLTISEPGGGDSSSIKSITVRVDVLESLRNKTISLGRLEGYGIRATVKQLEEGVWKVTGIPQRDTRTDPTPIMDFLTNIDSLSFSDIEIDLQTLKNSFRLTLPEGESIELTTQEELRRVVTTLNYSPNQESAVQYEAGAIALVGEFRGNPLSDDDFYGSAHVRVSPIPLSELLSPVRMNDLTLSALATGGDFWVEYDRGWFLLQGDLTVPVVSFSNGDNRRDVVTDLQAVFRWHGLGLWDWQMVASDIDFSLDGEKKHIDSLKVVSFINNRQRHLVASIDALDIGSISTSLLKLSEISDLLPMRTRTMIETMRPEGLLENVHFRLLYDEEPVDARMVAGIRDAQIRAHLGSPALSSLNGFVSVGPESGWIDIHNQDFMIRFASTFEEAWHFDSASGRLRFAYSPGLLTINSDLLRLSEKGMTVNGSFHVNLPKERTMQNWGLVIGISNADLSEKHRYLPFTISENAYEWIDQAVVSGHAIDSGLMIHGALDKEAASIDKSYELYFNVEEGHLDYDPGWPPVSEMVGNVYMGNWGVSARDMAAKIYDSQISTADVAVPFDLEGNTSVVQVQAKLSGSGSDGVRFLSETPLKDEVDHLADDWQAKGDISVTADLVIPIGETEQESEQTSAETIIGVEMYGNEILMPSYDILLQDIRGQLSYSDVEGLNSQRFTAWLLGGELEGKIESVTGASSEVIISADGSTTVEDLYDWSEQTILTRASGEFDYAAELRIPIGSQFNTSSLDAKSNLAGVRVDLPEPLRKPADETRDFRYFSTFEDAVQKMEVKYGSRFNSALVLEDDKVVGGLINFGEEAAQVPESTGVIIKGYLPKADLAEWQSLTDDLASKYSALSDVSLDAEMSEIIQMIYLEIGELHAFDNELVDVVTQAKRGDQRWELEILNPMLGGRFKVPDDSNLPLLVDLDYIRVDSEEGDDEDPLLEIDPESLGKLDFSTGEFSWDGENYGSWSFIFNPTDSGAEISNLTARVKGLKIGSKSEVDKQASVTWTKTEGQHRSHFEGFVSSSDLAKVLEEWGFASSIESQDVRVDTQLDWMGSPAMFSYETVTGSVNLLTEGGRFVQVQPGSEALQMLGIFDFASIARRFRFDFSDIVDRGFQFDEIKGVAFLKDGVIQVVEPIEIDSPGTILKIGGEVNLISEEIDGDMIVTLPVSRNLPWLMAITSGPVFGAGVFLAQKILLDGPIKQFSSAKYKMSGTIDEPKIEFITIFDNSVRQLEVEDPAEAEPTDFR